EPCEQKEICKFDSRLEKLGRFQALVQRRAHPILSERIGEGDTPKCVGWLAIATTGGKAANTADGMSERETGRKCVASGKGRHSITSDVPDGSRERSQESSGKNAAGLKGTETEDLARVASVVTPIIDDEEQFGPDDAGEHNEYA